MLDTGEKMKFSIKNFFSKCDQVWLILVIIGENVFEGKQKKKILIKKS